MKIYTDKQIRKPIEMETENLTGVELVSSGTDLSDGASTIQPSSRDLELFTALKKVTAVSGAAAIWAEYVKESEPMKFQKSLRADVGYIAYNAFRAGADWQAERTYSKKDMPGS